jgi:lysophospholipase L1-like esterase
LGGNGRFTLNAPQATLTNFALAMSINIDGGSPGAGGIPGIPGVGGAAGPRGNNSHGCKPATPRTGGLLGPQGAPGNRGPAGRPGVQADQAVSLRQIDAEAFIIEVSKPGIATLVPNPARCGQQIEVTGKGFAKTDSITIGGITCPATVQSDTTLQFTLIKVPGGIQFAQLVRSDGTVSNPASVYVQPTIDAPQAALRCVPGQKVRLQGSGFAPGMQVQVNNQDMPGVTFIDATTVEFQLVRPASVVQNSSGEVVSVKVVLADAGPDGASNTINLTLDTFRILAFGDSVVWGQGLEEPNKFRSLVEQVIRQRHGDIGVYKDVRAHSGATLKPRIGGTAFQNRLNGEVPTSFPTIFDQVLEFEDAPDAKEDFDLILLDGGINDVNVRTIISPLTLAAQLTSQITTSCHDDMLELLKELTATFTKARIIVTGYYQIISDQSDLVLLDVFMIALGLDLAAIPGAIFAGIATPEVRGKVSANCALFASEANCQLKTAVDEANAALGPGVAPRVFFADPKFDPANAALAPDSLVYGIHADLSPDDPASVAGPRAIACDAAGLPPTDVPLCKRASIGHPTAKGAQAYANAILPLL